MANLLINDLAANQLKLPGVGAFAPPSEVRSAVLNHPKAFRAGAVGPDFFPDMLLGQAVIHPEKSGKWLELMFDRLRYSPVAEREKNLSFALGYMFHYAGDMFGHAYVNSYANGWFPPYSEIASNPEKAKIVARHMLVETYMDMRVSASEDMSLSPPIPFVRDVFTCDAARRQMNEFQAGDTLTNPLGKFLILRDDVHNKLLDAVIGEIVGVTDYVQHWEADVDGGIDSWLNDVWAQIAVIFTSGQSDSFAKTKAILENWLALKLTSMVGIPDFIAKVIDFIKDLNILKPHKEYLMNLFKDYLIAIAKAITGQVYTDIEQAISALQAVFKDPKTYLDNGVVFPDKNVSQKLDADFGNYGLESDTTAQTFQAVLQCLNMGKLCLIGSDNLDETVKKAGASSPSFGNFEYLPAAAVRLTTVKTKTGSIFDFNGTNNNIYIGLKYGGKTYEVLCDKPNYDDFERGDCDTYSLNLPENVNLSDVSAITVRMSGALSDDWGCEFIEIKDSGGNVLFRTNGGFTLANGQRLELTNIQRAYNIPTSMVHIDPAIISFLYSLDGKGLDSSNPATLTQWQLPAPYNFPFYSDNALRSNVFKPLFDAPVR
jgi:hypothetical protein